MKKIISVFLAAITVFALFSCNNTTGTDTETDATADGLKTCNYGKIWKDYIVISDGNDGTLIKYNIHNGEMSFLCPDPFCRHEEDCQFAGVGVLSHSFDFIENTVYYANDEKGTGQNCLYSFDIDTSATKLLYESEGVIRDVHAYERRLFIREITGGRYNAESRCFWYDTITGKTEEYKGKQSGIKLNRIENDRMIWYSIFNHDLYFTDLEGNEYQDYDFGSYYGNHYDIEYPEYGDNETKSGLYVTFSGETERKLLKEGVGQVTFAENKIIYTKVVPKEERRVGFVDELGREYYDPYNGDVYIMNPDGSDDHLLFHCDEYISELPDGSNGLISGDYVGMYSLRLLEGMGNIFVLIIVNIKTGEFIVTENLQERYARLWSES